MDLLLEIGKELRASGRDIRVMLVGDGKILPRLESKVASESLQSFVTFTGPVPSREVPGYIAAMDICVLADSNVFGSPMALFEFMAMGKAVVAPDLMPIRDVIQHGENGIIVSRGDRAALRAAVAMLIDNPQLREKIGKNARKCVMEKHTWRSNAAQVVEAISLVRGKRSSVAV